MRRLLRAALALLLAAPALHHPHAAAAASHAGVRSRDEVFAPAPHRGPVAQAPAPKRGGQPASGPGLHPPAVIPAFAASLPRSEAGGRHLRPSPVPVPRSAKRPAYYATAPPR